MSCGEPGPGPTAELDDLDDLVERHLAALDLRQRIGQLNQRLFGWDCVRRSGPAAAPRYELTDTFHEEVRRYDGLGALYGLLRADAWSGRTWENGILPEHAAQVSDQVVEAVRAASPTATGPLLVEEAPHGHQALGGTLFPTNLGLGAAWDVDLVQECAAGVARELRSRGVHVGLVSTLDLLRDPRWGRSEECFSENPLLTADLTAAVVRGMQGTDRSGVRDGTGVAVVLKHLAGQGEGSGGRNGGSAVIGPHDFAELHLPAARRGVEAGALGLMGAYNDVDGIPCCANPALLTTTLRQAWGYDGLVMADGHAVDRLVALTGSESAAAALALRSGLDLSLWDRSFAVLEDAVAADPSLIVEIDRACRRVLRVKAELGLLGASGRARPADAAADADATTALSRRAAARSLVLLDDDAERPLETLPRDLAAGGRLVVTGPHAGVTTSLLGDYVPPLPQGKDTSVLAVLRDRFGERVEHCGTDVALEHVLPTLGPLDTVIAVVGGTSHRAANTSFADNGAVLNVAEVHESRTAPPTGSDRQLAEALRPSAGEGVDRADLELPGGQEALLERVAAGTPARLVAVVVCGRPHVLTRVVAAADTTIVTFYPGPWGGEAVVDALLGVRALVGRLPATFPRSTGVVPVHDDDRMPAEGRYHDAPDPVLGRFGSAHVHRPLPRSGMAVDVDGPRVRVRCAVSNPHDRDVEDVLQLFGHRRGGPRWPRAAELLAHRRVTVPTGTTVHLEFDLDARDVFAEDVPGEIDATTTLWWCPPGGGSARTDDPTTETTIRRAGGRAKRTT